MGTSEFPPPFSVHAKFAIAATLAYYSGPRKDVPDGPRPRPLFRNVVMIVDESVRGDYLQVNNAAYASTPFLAGLKHRLINFGSAVSAHNCSAPARLLPGAKFEAVVLDSKSACRRKTARSNGLRLDRGRCR